MAKIKFKACLTPSVMVSETCLSLSGLLFLRERFKRSVTSPPQISPFGIDGFYAAIITFRVLVGGEGYKSSVKHYLVAVILPSLRFNLATSVTYRRFTIHAFKFLLARFNKSNFNKDGKTLDVEAGCLWDELSMARSGSSIAGVGVAGWLLGGGYSLKTNQYELGTDSILGIKIVLPNGDIDYATKYLPATVASLHQ